GSDHHSDIATIARHHREIVGQLHGFNGSRRRSLSKRPVRQRNPHRAARQRAEKLTAIRNQFRHKMQLSTVARTKSSAPNLSSSYDAWRTICIGRALGWLTPSFLWLEQHSSRS